MILWGAEKDPCVYGSAICDIVKYGDLDITRMIADEGIVLDNIEIDTISKDYRIDWNSSKLEFLIEERAITYKSRTDLYKIALEDYPDSNFIKFFIKKGIFKMEDIVRLAMENKTAELLLEHKLHKIPSGIMFKYVLEYSYTLTIEFLKQLFEHKAMIPKDAVEIAIANDLNSVCFEFLLEHVDNVPLKLIESTAKEKNYRLLSLLLKNTSSDISESILNSIHMPTNTYKIEDYAKLLLQFNISVNGLVEELVSYKYYDTLKNVLERKMPITSRALELALEQECSKWSTDDPKIHNHDYVYLLLGHNAPVSDMARNISSKKHCRCRLNLHFTKNDLDLCDR